MMAQCSSAAEWGASPATLPRGDATARQQNCENRTVTLALQGVVGWRLPKSAGLLSREPVPQPDPEFLHAVHPANAGSETRAQQAAIGRFVGESPHSAEPQVYRARRQVSRFEMHGISKKDSLAE
jgi:hypothetical protein